MSAAHAVEPREELVEALSLNSRRLDFLFVHCASVDEALARLQARSAEGWVDWMGGPQKGVYAGYQCALTLFRTHVDAANTTEHPERLAEPELDVDGTALGGKR